MLLKKKATLIFLFLILCTGFVSAKSYTLEKAKIDISVNGDSSILINETITFNFDGGFTYAYRDIKYGEERIENIDVYEKINGRLVPLEYETSNVGKNTIRVKWYYVAINEKKTFVMSYTLKEALKVYNDAAEFYWKIWGEGWEVPLKEIEGTFELPEEVENNKDVYTWGHPKLDGKIAILGN
ncbi:MAG: DUF2207 domain-containing protein, partial [Candidatus Nanoarchaeia archaeon]